MEKEISSGAMLGIVLIALAAVIGLGFGVFAIAKGTANEGVTGLQENLNVVNQSGFTDYDQKIVTGTQVNSSYQNFTGKNVAILIATTSTIKEVGENNDLDEGAGIVAAYGDSKNVPLVETNVDTSYGEGNAKVKLKYINYNSILGKYTGTSGEGGSATPAQITRGTLRFDQNCYRWSEGFVSVNGKVQFNNTSGNMNKSGMMEYVSSGARFQSYLIKDDSGTIMGVAFEQIGTGN